MVSDVNVSQADWFEMNTNWKTNWTESKKETEQTKRDITTFSIFTLFKPICMQISWDLSTVESR